MFILVKYYRGDEDTEVVAAISDKSVSQSVLSRVIEKTKSANEKYAQVEKFTEEWEKTNPEPKYECKVGTSPLTGNETPEESLAILKKEYEEDKEIYKEYFALLDKWTEKRYKASQEFVKSIMSDEESSLCGYEWELEEVPVITNVDEITLYN